MRPCDATAAETRRRSRLIVAIASVLAVAALITWHKALKYRFVAKRWGVVEPGLIYRSGQISRWMIEKTLARHGIVVVVDLTSLDPASESQQAELAAVEKLGIRHVRLPLRGDGTGDIGRYVEAINVLSQCEQSGTPVLVHCAAGADRVHRHAIVDLPLAPRRAWLMVGLAGVASTWGVTFWFNDLMPLGKRTARSSSFP